MRENKNRRKSLLRAVKTFFLVCGKNDLESFGDWWRECIKRGIPCLTIRESRSTAEVKLDALTTREQGFGPQACAALEEVVDRWEAALHGDRGTWNGPVCFGIEPVPTARAEAFAGELLAALRVADPACLRPSPLSDADAQRRLSFLEGWDRLVRPPVQPDLVDIPKRQSSGGRRGRQMSIGTLSREQWDSIVDAYGGRCAYCDRKAKKIGQDHVLALARGGVHEMGNVVPACSECVQRRATRPVAEFLISCPDLPAARMRAALGLPDVRRRS